MESNPVDIIGMELTADMRRIGLRRRGRKKQQKRSLPL
uniref:Uncharacterized protein n=1 Tax=Brassica oleracea TaxID=3712 RepID=A0A3P6EWR6_BRAOL|nr:unnamed protein product [Brassica oleracea]